MIRNELLPDGIRRQESKGKRKVGGKKWRKRRGKDGMRRERS